MERTSDPNWPHLVDDRNISRFIVANLPDALRAYGQLREVSPGRFSDSDLYKIVLGAVLKINLFRALSAARSALCLEQHHALES